MWLPHRSEAPSTGWSIQFVTPIALKDRITAINENRENSIAAILVFMPGVGVSFACRTQSYQSLIASMKQGDRLSVKACPGHIRLDSLCHDLKSTQRARGNFCPHSVSRTPRAILQCDVNVVHGKNKGKQITQGLGIT